LWSGLWGSNTLAAHAAFARFGVATLQAGTLAMGVLGAGLPHFPRLETNALRAAQPLVASPTQAGLAFFAFVSHLTDPFGIAVVTRTAMGIGYTFLAQLGHVAAPSISAKALAFRMCF
jgi:hypothetical protein